MSINFSFGSGPQDLPGSKPEPDADGPFRIMVLGDFSGRGSRGETGDVASCARRKADLDTIDGLPEEVGARVRLVSGLELAIEEMDHFHPGELYARLPIFGALRDVRKRLNNQSTFADAAREVMGTVLDGAAGAAGAVSEGARAVARADDFASLLSTGFGSAASAGGSAIDALLKAAIGPHVVPADDPRKDELIATVDRAIAEQMREVLHDPRFRDLEACWLGLRRLVMSLELDESLTVTLADVSGADLAADADGRGIDALLDGPSRGEAPVALVLVLARFDASEEAIGALTRLASAAQRNGCVAVAGAHDRVLGVDALPERPDARDWQAQPIGDVEAWAALRAHEAASSLALVAPRHLERLPYGERTDEIDAFDFEELGEDAVVSAHAWGHPAVLVGLALGAGFTQVGWSIRPAGGADIPDLPVRAFADGSMLPCAEAWITDSSAEAMLERGITPVVSFRGRGAVRVGPLRSLAGGGLVARW